MAFYSRQNGRISGETRRVKDMWQCGTNRVTDKTKYVDSRVGADFLPYRVSIIQMLVEEFKCIIIMLVSVNIN